MPFNHEIPRITEPDYQAPESVSPIYDNVSWKDDRTSIEKGHYWKRIYSTVVGCGQEFTAKISTKFGVSHTVIEETSDSLDISVHVLKATLGEKVSTTDLINREETLEFSRKIAAKECDAITFAEWQRCDRFQITRFGRFLRPTRSRTIDIPLNDTYPDNLEYLDPHCCPTKFDDTLKQGYTEVYAIQTEEAVFAVLAKILASGKIQLDGIQGVFTPGQTIRTIDFPAFFRGKDEVAVIGRHPMGTVQQFYRMKPQRKHRVDLLPWLIAASAFLAASILSRKSGEERSESIDNQSEDFSRARQAAHDVKEQHSLAHHHVETPKRENMEARY